MAAPAPILMQKGPAMNVRHDVAAAVSGDSRWSEFRRKTNSQDGPPGLGDPGERLRSARAIQVCENEGGQYPEERKRRRAVAESAQRMQ